MSAPALTVLATGPRCTVQDLGRPGHAGLGVTRSGAADRTSLRLANRLVGNPEGAPALEVTLGGLHLRAGRPLLVAVAGATCAGAPVDAAVHLRAGGELRLGLPAAGLLTYVAVRGGLDVPRVLGSAATDTLSGLGPARLEPGDAPAVGPAPAGPVPDTDLAPRRGLHEGPVPLRLLPGPRADRLADGAWGALLTTTWTVGPDSDRVGARLLGEGDGTVPARADAGELPSEGLLRGAVQVPPSGRPVVFLADHPVTGGYPVLAYVVDAEPGPWSTGTDVDRLAQCRPGQQVRFTA
ncbi:biotin-dependent carboxyltransferase family protein [Aquipuribacter sp. SD81]|uniref:5-oxoprolinase subunit C family protein n=1 Tax=Aquipuribacter sp. SD81 TaxID=3127703 RepID=UPI0030185F32